jgi:ABC-2 type transport system ATP-binding protein
VLQNARFVAGLYGLGFRARRRRLPEVLQLLELWDDRNKLARDISGGMQRRLSLACGLFHQPRLLVVDEPTSGLDPALRSKIWDHLRQLRDAGTTIFVTTQHIDEADYCDRVGILREGRLLTSGAPDELRQRALGGEAVDVEANEFSRDDIAALWQLRCVHRVQWNGRRGLRVLVDDIGEATAEITRLLAERGTEVTAVRPYVPSFDEVFMALVED